jgi:5-methylcytosine-specific restriction endonuclease McrA
MWPVQAPTRSVESVLAKCISNIADESKRNNFANTAQLLAESANNFVLAAQTNTLHQFPVTDRVGPVSRNDMVWLYDKKLAASRSPGRAVYDEIKMAAPFGRCPLCGRGTVYTLDHHLPKTTYPDLSITPLNLVPSCQDCNKNKTQTAPTTAAEETLHPYFDNIDDEVWLQARMIEDAPASIFFFVAPPLSWSATMVSRVRNHFKIYRLGELYASVAAEELSNIRGSLITLRTRSGDQSVRGYLSSIVSSYRLRRRNTWQAAAYSAMAESDWFCGGGFDLAG